ncbi:MAG: hypothetical protein ACLS37_10810 [Alistipes sp.]
MTWRRWSAGRDLRNPSGENLALKDRIVIVSGMVKYSDYSGTNNLQSTKSTIIHIV